MQHALPTPGKRMFCKHVDFLTNTKQIYSRCWAFRRLVCLADCYFAMLAWLWHDRQGSLWRPENKERGKSLLGVDWIICGRGVPERSKSRQRQVGASINSLPAAIDFGSVSLFTDTAQTKLNPMPQDSQNTEWRNCRRFLYTQQGYGSNSFVYALESLTDWRRWKPDSGRWTGQLEHFVGYA